MKPLFSGAVATILGIIGTSVMSAVALVPAPWSTLVGLVGFLVCAIAGLSVAPPNITAGKPLVQGFLLSVAIGLITLIAQFYVVIPDGWPKSLALAVAGLLAWLAGVPLPALGSPSAAQLEAAKAAGEAKAATVDTKPEVISILGEK